MTAEEIKALQEDIAKKAAAAAEQIVKSALAKINAAPESPKAPEETAPTAGELAAMKDHERAKALAELAEENAGKTPEQIKAEELSHKATEQWLKAKETGKDAGREI